MYMYVIDLIRNRKYTKYQNRYITGTKPCTSDLVCPMITKEIIVLNSAGCQQHHKSKYSWITKGNTDCGYKECHDKH